MYRLAIVLIMLVFVLCVGSCNQTSTTVTPRPNIVFILIDDMGYGDLSITGNSDVSTPNIDSIATNGQLFEHFYVASPICSPSRVALFTGHSPANYNIHSFIHSREANRQRAMANYLPEDAFTLADLTRSAGYRTSHIGKWHMGGGRDVGDAPLPAAYGFDSSYVSFEGLGDRLLFSDHQNRLSARSANLGQGHVDWLPKHQTSAKYVNKALDFISQADNRPFYLQLWLNDVHAPHMPSDSMLSAQNKSGLTHYQQQFNAILKNMDKQLGRLFDHLKQQGLYDNTLIIVTSDNGPVSTKKYYVDGQTPPGSTAGLRGRKWSLYEGGIRMPLLVQWPAKIPQGQRDSTTLIAATDLLPTLAELLAVPAPKGEGISVLSSWLGTPSSHRSVPIMWEFGSTGDTSAQPQSYVATERSPHLAIRDNQWKLLVNPDGTQIELYNIIQDPFESRNVADQHLDIVQRLAKQVREWRANFRLPTS